MPTKTRPEALGMFINFRKRLAGAIAPELKFTPASAEVNWQRIETLVHGPGASEYLYGSDVFNTAVLSCLFAIATAYTEPPLTVYKKLKDGKTENMSDEPLQELLDKPTPNNELTIDEIRFWVAWAKHTDGNAYLLKVRSGDETRGNVVELWPISPTLISPYTEKDSGDWITYYKYQVRPGVFMPIPPENVIHLKSGLKDGDMRKGISRIKHLVRHITSDNEAEKFTASLLANYAIPGLVAWPANGGNMTREDADELTAKLRTKFGGDNRGNIAVLSKESKVEQFGFNPEQMNMPGVHNHAEERISGVMGIPALLAGLGAGLQRSIQDNGRELREFFTETKLVPEWNADGRKLTASLREDFTSDKNVFIAHDLTDVRALQEDEDAKYSRLATAVGKPFMKRNEARADLGLDPIPAWDTEDVVPPVVVAPVTEDASTEGTPQPEEDSAKLFVDLERWQRKAVKAWQANDRGRLLEDFAFSVIPGPERIMIMELLEVAQSEEDIKRIFGYQNGHKA